MSRHHYFVTGAQGFVGRHLCRHLLARGHAVTGLFRRAPEAADLPEGLMVATGVIEEPDGFAACLGAVTHVVHLAGEARFGNGAHYRAANVDATQRLMDGVARHCAALERFVFVSTLGAVDRTPDDTCDTPLTEESPPRPSTDYGRSKLEAEDTVRRAALPFAIVRPCLVVGADMRADSHVAVFARWARGALGLLALPGRFSVIHIDDLCSALEIAAEHPDAAGRIFFAAGSPLSLAEIFDAARPRTRLPVGVIARLLRPVARFLPLAAKSLVWDALVADDAALRALGWAPAHSGLETIADVLRRERLRFCPEEAPPGATIITGAASGLGRSLAEHLAATGRKLVLIDRDSEALDGVLPGHHSVRRVVLDLADPAALAAALASPPWHGEAVDELFACAGFGLRGAVAQLPAQGQADMVQVNVTARLLLARALLPGMMSRGFGRIVLISSSSAFQPLPLMTVYAATNAAVLFLGEGLAQEVAGSGVRVLTICPGGMKTNFQRSAGVRELEKEKLMTPDAVAREILAGLASGRFTVSPSLRAKAMALLARILPRRVSVILWHRLMAGMR